MKIALASQWLNDGTHKNYIGDHGIALAWQKWLMRLGHEVNVGYICYVHRWKPDIRIWFHGDHPAFIGKGNFGLKDIFYVQNSYPKSAQYPNGTLSYFGAWYKKFDAFLFASEGLRKACNAAYGVDGGVIPFATDPEVFFPNPFPEWTCNHPVVFLGNNVRPQETHERFLYPAIDHGLAIYGGPYTDPKLQRCHRGRLPQEMLPHLYNSPAIFLNFHIPIALEHSIVNSRIYDLLACGSMVVSEPFEGDLAKHVWPTQGGADLAGAIHELRRSRGTIQQPDMREHTWEKRMETLLQYLKGI